MALIDQAGSTLVPRATLAEVFKDPRLLLAIEQVLAIANETPAAVNTLADAGMWLQTGSTLLPNARAVNAGTGVTLDYSVPGQVTLNVFVAINTTTRITGLVNAEDDAAAAAAGVAIGEPYMNGSVFQVRMT